MNRRQFLKTTAIATSACVLPLPVLKASLNQKRLSDMDIFPTGHLALDKALGGGIRRETFTIVCGKRGSGCSKFLQDIYRNIVKIVYDINYVSLDGESTVYPKIVTIGKNSIGYLPDLAMKKEYNSVMNLKLDNDMKIGKNFETKDTTIISKEITEYNSFLPIGLDFTDFYISHLVILLDNNKITIIKNRYGKTGIVA